MATLAELEAAFVKADDAALKGDKQAAEDAASFAAEIRKMRLMPKAPIETPQFEKDAAAGPQLFEPAQIGMGALRGAAGIGSTLLKPIDMLTGNTDRRAQIDAALQNMGADPSSLSFNAGKIGTEIAGTAGAGGLLAKGLTAIPGAASVASPLIDAVRTSGMASGGLTGAPGFLARAAGGATTGATAAGLINPEDATSGAAVGAVVPGVMQGLGGLASMFSVKGPNADLAKRALDQGIPVGIGDIAQGKALQATRSILNDAPLTGAMGNAQREARQAGFNRAVGRTFGEDAPKLTADIIDRAQTRLGGEFDRIWNNNNLLVDNTLSQKMFDLQKIAKKLPRNEGGSLQAEIDDLVTKMRPTANGGVEIPGDVANKFQSYLRRRIEGGSSGLKNELGDLRKGIIDAFNASVAPQDAAALTLTREQYKAFKTVQPLLNSAEVGVAGRMPGDVPAALLPNAVASRYSSAAGTPLADIAQMGSQFLVDRTKQTGGSMRAAVQNSLIGAGLMGGMFTNPALTAAAIPTAAGVQGLLGSPAIARYALSQPGPISTMLRRAPYAVAPVLSAQ